MTTAPSTPAPGEHLIRHWMTARIADMLGMQAGDISVDAVLGELGLSSVQAVELAADLESWTGREVPATLVFECPTVRDVARHVAGGRI